MENLLIFGCGNMAEAILAELISKKIYNSGNIAVYDKIGEKSARLTKLYGVSRIPAGELAGNFGTILLAVKPQNFDEAAELLKKLKFELLITILAGTRCETFEKTLGEVPVLRVMPNIAIRVGNSVSGLFANKYLGESAKKDELRKTGEKIFSSCGEIYWFEEEKFLDKITAISGSGPGYVCFFIEAMEKAAQKLGLGSISEKIVLETFAGTIEFLKKTKIPARKMREMITSPGGTTEQAVKFFEEEHLAEAIEKGIEKALKRAEEIGK
ncbi:MAG: pyrroline-5-carboxylate reductase [Elusimicrobia bacterium]|nr:pyrroline-5-carboxylate reductase [Elusimicrobiota bacterium]